MRPLGTSHRSPCQGRATRAWDIIIPAGSQKARVGRLWRKIAAAKFGRRESQPALIPVAIKSLLAPSLRAGIGSPSASNPRGRPRHKSAESPASSFALLTILIRSLVACSHAAIFVGFPESFPTLLIASLLI